MREKSDTKRQAILDAALDLFIDRHFHGTSVPAIAEKALVADGTIYRYFPSKEALVNELYLEKKRELIAHVTRPFEAGASLKDRLTQIGLRFLEYAEANPRVVYFLERNHHESYLTEAARNCELELITFVVEQLEEGKRAGIIKPVRNEVLIFILYGALTGLVEGRRRGLISNLEDIRSEAEECLWHAIRA